MISLFQAGQGLQHMRNIFGAAPVNRWAWASDGLNIYSLAKDGLFQIGPSGKQKMNTAFNFEELAEPQLHFDRSQNELLIISGSDVYCLASGSIYQRLWTGSDIVHVRDWGGLPAVSADAGSIFRAMTAGEDPGNTIRLKSQPMYLGAPSETKRIKDIWITVLRKSENAQRLTLLLKGDQDDIQLNETLDFGQTVIGKPQTVRIRLRRVLANNKFINDPARVWSLTEFTNDQDNQMVAEFYVNAANKPCRWFELELQSNDFEDSFIQAVEIGYTNYGAR